MFVTSRGSALRQAVPTTSTLPAFLVPALQTSSTAPRRHFSATAPAQSKLGRTPISIPPGVEIMIGAPKIKKDATTYLQVAKRTVTVTGPLGTFHPDEEATDTRPSRH